MNTDLEIWADLKRNRGKDTLCYFQCAIQTILFKERILIIL